MEWLESLYGYVWGIPLIILLLGNGIYLAFCLRGLQFRYLLYALKLAFSSNSKQNNDPGDISHFESLMTAFCSDNTFCLGLLRGKMFGISCGCKSHFSVSFPICLGHYPWSDDGFGNCVEDF